MSDVKVEKDEESVVVDDIDVLYDGDSKLWEFLDRLEKTEETDPFSDAPSRREIQKFQKNHTGIDGAKRESLETGEINNYGLYELAEPRYNLTYLSLLYELCGPNSAAIDAKVDNIVGLGYQWIDSNKTKRKIAGMENEERIQRARRKVERTKEMLDDFLGSVNNMDHFVDVMEAVVTDIEATGNGYLEVGRTVNGQIGYLGHIPADTMRVRKRRDGFVQIIADRKIFFRNYGDKETPNPIDGTQTGINEVIHFKNYTPSNDYYGIPDILKAQEAMAGNKFSSTYNLEYFERKAVPRYALIVKGGKLSTAAEQRLVNYFRNNVKGKHHGTLYIPVPAATGDGKIDVELRAIEAGTQEASFVKYFALNREEMLMVHRVPPSEVGLTGDVNNAMGQASAKMFKEKVIAPKVRRIERKIIPIFLEVTDLVTFKFKEYTLADSKTQAEIDEKDIRWDIRTVNEVRAKKGLSRVPWGDAPSFAMRPDYMLALKVNEVREFMGKEPLEGEEGELLIAELGTNTQLTADEVREQRAQGRGSRTRDQERESGPDKDGDNRAPRGGE